MPLNSPSPRRAGSGVPVWTVLVVLAALALGAEPVSRLVTDGWWFGTVGHAEVFRTVLVTRALLALVGVVFALAIVGGSARLAARFERAPAVVPRGPVGRTPPRIMAAVVTAVIALASGAAGWGSWDRVLLAWHGGPMGFSDPVWGLDAGFYVFTLPAVTLGLQWLLALVGAAMLVAAATYVASGTVRVQLSQQDGQLVATGLVLPAEVRRHLATLAAVSLVIVSVLTYLARYHAMSAQGGLFVGPGYADLYGTLPLLTVQAVGTAIAAFGAFVAIDGGSLLGIGGVAALLVVLRLATAAVPGLIQRFSVEPNELSREGPQIIDHLAATRFAFDLDAVEELPLSGVAELDSDDLQRNRVTVENVALWDHGPLLEAYSQIQEIRTYYGFVSVDNDRYRIGGDLRQVVLSPRELTIEELQPEARTWVNETMTYTHGYGVAVGPVNEVTAQGLPELFVRDVPPKVTFPDVFGIERPELYFGEAIHHPVVVGTDNPEFDYPSGEENAYTRYQGQDGVRLGTLGRLLFALRLGSTEVLLSSDVDRDSRVLLYRNILQRAARIAPMLRYDSDPYLVVDRGRLVWMLDGYTTSGAFPYAAKVKGFGSYARNPVKVTIDAYDGTTRFYRTPARDPIADAWEKVFPGLFLPLDQLAPSLQAHLRTPQDLFDAQATLFATYHMQDHQVFYNREDEWEVPVVKDQRMQPYYTLMRLPGETEEEFLLMLPFSPRGKPNLAAWMVARSDGEHYGQLRVYKFPKDTMVYGPKMVVARMDQDDTISEKVSLWSRQGSEVRFGTLMVIPIEDALIYVRPLYLRASSGSIPELKRVIVAYQDRIAMTPTLEEGLEQLFGPPPAPEPPPAAADGMAVPQVTSAELIRLAAMHWEAAQNAAAKGDWSTWGTHQQALGELIEALAAGTR